ncbi:MAG: hypothetical protein NTX49_07795 [Chlamydiae bacterium]|nr:hypothetical protein [Chlamydiota bacterium]
MTSSSPVSQVAPQGAYSLVASQASSTQPPVAINSLLVSQAIAPQGTVILDSLRGRADHVPVPGFQFSFFDPSLSGGVCAHQDFTIARDQDSMFSLGRTSEGGSELSLASAASASSASTQSTGRDNLNNRVVSSLFETAVSLEVLTKPPVACVTRVNVMAGLLATKLELLRDYAESHPEATVHYKGKDVKIMDVLQKAILANMNPGNPKGKFLGRYRGAEAWSVTPIDNLNTIINVLKKTEYSRDEMLLKILALSEFGEMLTDLLPAIPVAHKDSLDLELSTKPEIAANRALLVGILGGQDFSERLLDAQYLGRNVHFDTERHREQRFPTAVNCNFHVDQTAAVKGIIVGDKFIPLEHDLSLVPKKEGSEVQIYSGRTFDAGGTIICRGSLNEEDYGRLAETVEGMSQLDIITKALEGISSREDKPMPNTYRAGIFTGDLDNLPLSFAGLAELIRANPYEHVSGIDNWILPDQGLSHKNRSSDLPTAGAHSGTTSDIMIACESLLNREVTPSEAQELRVMIHAYMIFGACHTMAEIYPVVGSYIGDRVPFLPAAQDPLHASALYDIYLEDIKAVTTSPTVGGAAAAEVAPLLASIEKWHHAFLTSYGDEVSPRGAGSSPGVPVNRKLQQSFDIHSPSPRPLLGSSGSLADTARSSPESLDSTATGST